MLLEDWRQPIDMEWIGHWRSSGQHAAADYWQARLKLAEKADPPAWPQEEMTHWDGTVYREHLRDEAARNARRTDGNRMRARWQYLFGPTDKSRWAGNWVIDVGCGEGETALTLANPATLGYRYVGVDLSRNGLQCARQDSPSGDYVQADVEHLPFRPNSARALLVLGTLHHLRDWRAVLVDALDLAMDDAQILIYEAIERPVGLSRFALARRLGRLAKESEHENRISAQALLSVIATHAEIEHVEYEYSPVRTALVHFLGSRLTTNSRLTSVVLWLDHFTIRTLGHFVPVFGAGAIFVRAIRSRRAPI